MADPVVQWQALVRDPERASAFHAAAFGWQIDDRNALGYRAIAAANGGIGGGFGRCPKVSRWCSCSSPSPTSMRRSRAQARTAHG